MNETSTDEQVVAKALDTVVFPANDFSSTNGTAIVNNNVASPQSGAPAATAILTTTPPSDTSLGPAGLPNQPLPEHEFPKITPIHDSSDIYYKPQANKVPAPVSPPAQKEQAEAPAPSKKTSIDPAGAGQALQNIEVKNESTPDSTPNEVPAKSEEQGMDKHENKNESPVDDSPLNEIKRDALSELRPLVDKLTVSPEEKFDTLLLMIRSTDDSSLIEQAHEAAKLIEDESKRAEALLEIIKEIDYLSHQNKSN
jgi:hypothetical protein